MHNGKKILSIIGAIIKWLCLISVLCGLIKIFTEIGVSSSDETGNDFLSIVVCGLIAFAGNRLERYGKSGKPLKKDYKPTGVVSNGEFIYKFTEGEDLFADGKEGLAYQELSWDFQIIANLGKHILDHGGVIRIIWIGGGSDEVAHTGTAAYSNGYSSLESFVEKCMKDIDDAASDAGTKYGGWFSSLDYNFIEIYAKIKETDIKVRCFGPWITVSFPLGNGSEGFSYLTDLAYRFGSKDFHQGADADEFFWDSSLKAKVFLLSIVWKWRRRMTRIMKCFQRRGFN